MTAVAEKVLREALTLPPVDRAGLIEMLFRSFDSPGNSLVDSAWVDEVEFRLDAYNRGEMDASPAEDVLARINRR